jgi:hypothetical protein
MKTLIIICLLILFSCQKQTYCWQCESKVKDSVTYFEICDKSEPEIRQFEKSYTHPGPVVTTMKCKMKVNE